MKKQIYAISLLLSFLVVLSHQVILHHHHDEMAYNFITNHVETDGDSHEHNDKHHHHDSNEESNNEKDTDKDHKHPFPLHQHVSATNDFDYARTSVLESNQNLKNLTSFHVSNIILGGFSELPKFTNLSFRAAPFIIKNLFKPGAIALRGPPSIV